MKFPLQWTILHNVWWGMFEPVEMVKYFRVYLCTQPISRQNAHLIILRCIGWPDQETMFLLGFWYFYSQLTVFSEALAISIDAYKQTLNFLSITSSKMEKGKCTLSFCCSFVSLLGFVWYFNLIDKCWFFFHSINSFLLVFVFYMISNEGIKVRGALATDILVRIPFLFFSNVTLVKDTLRNQIYVGVWKVFFIFLKIKSASCSLVYLRSAIPGIEKLSLWNRIHLGSGQSHFILLLISFSHVCQPAFKQSTLCEYKLIEIHYVLLLGWSYLLISL